MYLEGRVELLVVRIRGILEWVADPREQVGGRPELHPFTAAHAQELMVHAVLHP